MSTNDVYLGNPNLKKAEPQFNLQETNCEWIKCKNDPIYFAMNYIKIISLDEGLVPFSMYDFKRNLRDFITIDSTLRNSQDKLESQLCCCLSIILPIFYDSVNIYSC